MRKSYDKYLNQVLDEQKRDIYGIEPNIEVAQKIAWKRTKKDERWCSNIQYQINTLMTTNGQSPFVTLFMHFDPVANTQKKRCHY